MTFFILKKSNFLHIYLLGDSEYPSYWNNYPCTEVPKYLEEFFIIKKAYYSYELVISLIYHRERKDFSELILHHIITISLVSCAYSTN